MANILIVEDEPKLAALLADYLRAAGHAPRCVGDGQEAVDRVRAEPPDLLLLDLMLPSLDGLEVCRELRRFSDVPIIMITARVEEIDRLIGLETGADDYVCKPFSPREVVARVKAILRRSRGGLLAAGGGGDAAGAPGPLQIDAALYRAVFHGVHLELTPVEWRLLQALAEAPGRVFSRDRLLDRIHADGRAVADRTIDSHIRNLRRKLESGTAGRRADTLDLRCGLPLRGVKPAAGPIQTGVAGADVTTGRTVAGAARLATRRKTCAAEAARSIRHQ